MITSAIIPRPLARLPWRLIFLIAGIAGFGLVVLYSAAGGSVQPWALKQGIVFLFFLGVPSGCRGSGESTIKAVVFPVYGVTLSCSSASMRLASRRRAHSAGSASAR